MILSFANFLNRLVRVETNFDRNFNVIYLLKGFHKTTIACKGSFRLAAINDCSSPLQEK